MTPDAVTITCSLCSGALVAHCDNPDCDWLVCRDKRCEADRYDVHRGVLLRVDRRVVRL